MSTAEAQTIVIDVATKRRPQSRQALREAVSVLEGALVVKVAVVKNKKTA